MKPCVVVVGYNRPHCLKRILRSISSAKYPDNNIPLVISLDKAKDDNGCLQIANEFNWEHGKKIVRTFPERQGLRKHILQCGDLSNEYGSVIILEDDLLVSPMFYLYASSAQEFYKDSPEICGVSLYSHSWNGYANKSFAPIIDQYDVYLGQFSITWGECWTKEQWNRFKNWYENNQTLDLSINTIPKNVKRWPETSWGKYFAYYIVENNLFYVIPRVSLSTNCSDVGEHAKYSDPTHRTVLLESTDFKYRFGNVNGLYKYDLFFENISLKYNSLKNYQDNGGVCIDLNSTKYDINERYILSTKRLNYKVAQSYGLLYRPIDNNVTNESEGNSIFLYDTTIKDRKQKSNKYNLLKYEFKGYKVSTLFTYSLKLALVKIKRKVFKSK